MRTNPKFDFSHLTPAERIELAQDLWDSLDPAHVADAFPLTDEQRAELDRRLAELDANPGLGRPWEDVEAEIRARIRKGSGR
jgi:putative addiction module component (TIGR02574 family)